jgi:tyrosine-specific transport protein
MAQKGPGTGKIVTTSLVVTGNMVGAGILALPINLGPSGLIPAIVGTVVMWILMTCTALVYSRQKTLVEGDGADLPTFFGVEFGPAGQWVSIGANLIILYGLLTAYLDGVTSIVVNLFDLAIPQWGVMFCYFILAVLLTSFGAAVMRRGNAVLMLVLWGAFAALVVLTMPHMSGKGDFMHDWSFLPSGLPVLLTAFHFHNIVPTLCRTLGQDRKAITTAIWTGTSIGLVMNVIWMTVVITALPMTGGSANIIVAFTNNLPATVPLSKIIGSTSFTDIALVFSVVAMTTSFMANGIALQGFMGDLSGLLFKTSSKAVVWILSFIPPLLVGWLYPDLFLIALDVAGGIGINILFGIMPGILLVKYSEVGSLKRIAGYLLVAVFSAVLLVEIGQELGVLHISPNVEYWTARHF